MGESNTAAPPSRSRSLSASIKGLFGKNSISSNEINGKKEAFVQSGTREDQRYNEEHHLKKIDTKASVPKKDTQLSPLSAPGSYLKKSTSIASSLHLNSGKQSVTSSRAQSISSDGNGFLSQESFISEEHEDDIDDTTYYDKSTRGFTNLSKEVESYSISRKNSIQQSRKASVDDNEVDKRNDHFPDSDTTIDSVLGDKNKNQKVMNQINSMSNISRSGSVPANPPILSSKSRRGSNAMSIRSPSVRSTASIVSGNSNSEVITPSSKPATQNISEDGNIKKTDNTLKCVINSKHFKVYENGFHEHHLPVIDLVKGDSTDSLNSSTVSKGTEGIEIDRQKSSFSLTGIFKKKNGDKMNELLDTEPFGNASSLMPTKAFCPRYKTKDGSMIEESLEQETTHKKIPKIVNPYAAVGSEELKLITTLSDKIKKGLKNKDGQSRSGSQSGSASSSLHTSPVASSTSLSSKFHHALVTCSEKYGDPVGVIGHGTYGVVRVCSRPLLISDSAPFPSYCNDKKLFFAIKVLKPKDDEQLEKFSTRVTSEFIIGHSLSRRHKAHALQNKVCPSKRLAHKAQRKLDWECPNILRVIDLMETNNTFIEVMEFCPAGDLHSLLVSRSQSGNAIGSLHPLEADCFMKQLLRGVQYMHDHGIAHCDLKPENLLFHPNGLLKICDFGTSSVFQTAWEKHVHFQNGVIGSEPYVAPEVFQLGKDYDPRLIDCWSCGIVYCTMVFGQYLWKIAIENKDSLYASFISQMKDENQFSLFEELRHVNADLNKLRKNVLYNMFQSNPEKRITVDKILHSSWMKHTRCCVSYNHSV